MPSDITLSQFLSIQEKGVSAWSFEPDYETVSSLLVHARTEITFLPDPDSTSCVQSNLPLPKLNEVYYWETKMFDLPTTTNVAVGLATKPYPTFRLPGLSKFSIAYQSNGDKSYNYPFTATTFGAPLKEGDVLGVGYRPRSGTVFFTRNGRKMEDAFTGLSRWNLFPTIGADGPCSVHVNLGQAGFVFVEANVKKWGLAPSVGTLAPPPAYGSERGSILLDVGGGVRASAYGSPQSVSGASSPTPSSRRIHRSRRPRYPGGEPVVSSPLRTAEPITPPPPITPIDEEPPSVNDNRYISPTDLPFHTPPNSHLPTLPSTDEASSSSPSSDRSLSPGPGDVEGARNMFSTPRRLSRSLTHIAASLTDNSTASNTHPHHHHHQRSGSNGGQRVAPSPDSPMTPDPPTPNPRDIHLQSLSSRRRNGSNASRHTFNGEDVEEDEEDDDDDRLMTAETAIRRLRAAGVGGPDPPAYSPLDAFTYADGVQIDLPAEVITAALEGTAIPAHAIGGSSGRTDRHQSGRSDRRRDRR